MPHVQEQQQLTAHQRKIREALSMYHLFLDFTPGEKQWFACRVLREEFLRSRAADFVPSSEDAMLDLVHELVQEREDDFHEYGPKDDSEFIQHMRETIAATDCPGGDDCECTALRFCISMIRPSFHELTRLRIAMHVYWAQREHHGWDHDMLDRLVDW